MDLFFITAAIVKSESRILLDVQREKILVRDFI